MRFSLLMRTKVTNEPPVSQVGTRRLLSLLRLEIEIDIALTKPGNRAAHAECSLLYPKYKYSKGKLNNGPADDKRPDSTGVTSPIHSQPQAPALLLVDGRQYGHWPETGLAEITFSYWEQDGSQADLWTVSPYSSIRLDTSS